MRVAGLLGDDDAVGEHLSGFGESPETRQKLAKLKIPGYVTRMGCEQLLKMPGRSLIVTQLCTFECQAIPRKRIAWVRLDKPFEDLASRLLCLSHR
jgi:hypothetical protein